MSGTFSIKGNYVDVFQKQIYPACVTVTDDKITAIEKIEDSSAPTVFLLPGFIDAHVHVESSLLPPSSFARMAVVHGTVATVSDPHEIANVCGIKGVEYMMHNAAQVPFHFAFGAPSCVPATVFETAGAVLSPLEVEALLGNPAIYYLSEMMNFPGVLHHDEEVMKKINAALRHQKPIDGHAPGLRGEQAAAYITANKQQGVIISTDHECFTAAEALDKLKYGMKIIIREGSAARNFEALVDLLQEHFEQMMFCSDDKHPDSLKEGHINSLVKRAVAKGVDLFKVLQVACVNPVKHYQLPVGMLRVGDTADFIVVDSLQEFRVQQTYIAGKLVAENGNSLIGHIAAKEINNFNCNTITPGEIIVPAADGKIKVIEAIEGQLITNTLLYEPVIENNSIVADLKNDVLKLVCVNRYQPAKPSVAFIKNFNLKKGALASSVAHDSHNIIAVGTDDESICNAVNAVIKEQGGLSVCDAENNVQVLPLPIAGLMSNRDAYEVEKIYTSLNTIAKQLGTHMNAPFMTLSFMALLVIPQLKLSDKGLFDGEKFQFVSLQ